MVPDRLLNSFLRMSLSLAFHPKRRVGKEKGREGGCSYNSIYGTLSLASSSFQRRIISPTLSSSSAFPFFLSLSLSFSLLLKYSANLLFVLNAQALSDRNSPRETLQLGDNKPSSSSLHSSFSSFFRLCSLFFHFDTLFRVYGSDIDILI